MGRSHIVRGSGDDRQDFYHNQVYAHSKKTIWGSVFKTRVIDEGGENVVFGTPWCPEEGLSYGLCVNFKGFAHLNLLVFCFLYHRDFDNSFLSRSSSIDHSSSRL